MGIPDSLREGVDALLAGDLDRAQARFAAVLALDPSNEIADGGLKNVVQDRVLRHLNLPALPAIVEKKVPGGVAEFLAALAPYSSRAR